MLMNPFYIGRFNWGGRTYQGTQPILISSELFSRVQMILHGYNKPKYGKKEIAFRGLLKCAHDDCTVTGEIKKGKYVYYRCSHGRGPCDLPYFREEQIVERMGHVLRDVCIPPDVALGIEAALERGHAEDRTRFSVEQTRLEHTLETLHRRVDAAYIDKLDGKIPEEFGQRKQAEWQQEESTIKGRISTIEAAKGANPLPDARRILELAQSAYSLYVTRKPAEQCGITEKSAFELLYRCRKSLSYLYIPLRHHL